MKNKYEIRGDTIAIYIKRKGGIVETLIDYDDLSIADSYPNTWCCDFYGYIYSSNKKLKLHRVIMNAPDGSVIDHINHNPLDNRKSNLRIVTHSQNMKNINGPHKNNNTSGVRGVSWSKGANKWMVSMMVNRKRTYLGIYDDLEEAKEVAEKARAKHMEYSDEFGVIEADDFVIPDVKRSDVQSGIKGIHWDNYKKGGWRVMHKGKKSRRYDTLEEAIIVLEDLKKQETPS